MAQAATHRRRQRTLRLLAAALLIAVLTSPLWFNLLLATPLVTGPVERAIHHRIGLECRIQRFSYWPWSGLSVHGLEIPDPDDARANSLGPLVQVRAIHINLRWRSLLRGKVELEELWVIEPRVDLPVELLLAAIPATPPTAVPSTLAANSGEVEEPPSLPSEPSGNASPIMPSTKPAQPQPPSKPTKPTQPRSDKPTPSEPAKIPSTKPTRWCHIEEASLRLRSTTWPDISLEFDKAGGSIPIGGQAAQSRFQLGRIRLDRDKLGNGTTVNIEWADSTLRFKIHQLAPEARETNIEAVILARPGIPFEVRSHSPMQDTDGQWLGPKGLQARSSQLGYRAELSGYLKAPTSWRGGLLAGVRDAQVRVPPHLASFESGSFHAQLFPGGWLHCGHADLHDDEAALMVRGDLWSDGSFAASLRLVTNPQQAAGIASTLFPDAEQTLPLTPLSTPQRCAFDLVASGRPGQIELRAGPDGPLLDFPFDSPHDSASEQP